MLSASLNKKNYKCFQIELFIAEKLDLQQTYMDKIRSLEMSKESAVDAMRHQKDAEMSRLKTSRSQTSHAALTLKSQFDELKTSYLGLVKQVRQFPNVISKTINILRTEVMLYYCDINNETRLKKNAI